MAGGRIESELNSFFTELAHRLGPLDEELHVYLAGDVAAWEYVGDEVKPYAYLDLKLSHKIAIHPDLQEFRVPDGDSFRLVQVDGGISDVMGSFPPNWEEKSPLAFVAGGIYVHVIQPVDLAVSLVGHMDYYSLDAIRSLSEAGLVDAELFKERMRAAIDLYVGDTSCVEENAAAAEDAIREASQNPSVK